VVPSATTLWASTRKPPFEPSQPRQGQGATSPVAAQRLEALPVIGLHGGVGVEREAVCHGQPRVASSWLLAASGANPPGCFGAAANGFSR
jgi:hypothetical protein